MIIQAGAGDGSAIADRDFKAAGAQIVDTAEQVWAEADLLLKVKEPIEAEYAGCARARRCSPTCTWRRPSRAPTRCWHRAPPRSPTRPCRPPTARCRLLAPMSEVAGRLSAQVGAYHLMRTQGGRGVLMGGVPGVAPAKVVVIGGGMAGDNAAAVPGAWART